MFSRTQRYASASAGVWSGSPRTAGSLPWMSTPVERPSLSIDTVKMSVVGPMSAASTVTRAIPGKRSRSHVATNPAAASGTTSVHVT